MKRAQKKTYIFNFLKKTITLVALVFMATTSAIWGTDYIYDGNWTPGMPFPLNSGDTVTITSNFSYNGDFTIPLDVTLSIDSGAILEIQNGGLTIEGTLNNSGTITNAKQFNIGNTGSVINNTSGTITSGNASQNDGTFINKGSFTASGGNYTNNGSIENSGNFTANNTLTNSGTISNTASLTVSGGDFSNSGELENTGNIACSNTLNNTGSIESTGSIKNTSGTNLTPTGNGAFNESQRTTEQTYYWVGTTDGNWNKAANWNTNVAGTGKSGIPGTVEGDIAYIPGTATYEIIIPENYTANLTSIYTNSGGRSTGNVTLTINGSLAVTKLLTNTGNSSSGNTIININGAFITKGDADIAGDGTGSGIFTNSSTTTNTTSGSSGSTTINVNKDTTITNLYINELASPNKQNNSTGLTTIKTTGNVLFDISGRIEMSGRANSKSNSTLNIEGNGEVACYVFDPAIDDNNYTQRIEIDSPATFTIDHHYFGDGKSGKTNFTGSGTLKIPASGAYLNYGTTCSISYGSDLKILPSCDPSYYDIKFSGLKGFPTSNISIQLILKNMYGGNQIVSFPYIIKKENIEGDYKINSYTVNGTNQAEVQFNNAADKEGTLKVKAIEADTSQTITISSKNKAPGDKFKIDIYTPDHARILASLEWENGQLAWTGDFSSDWNNPDNWIGLTASTVAESLTNTTDLIITKSCNNFPTITETDTYTYNLNSLSIAPNASITISGGTLNVNSITVAEAGTRGTISQTGGTINTSSITLNGSSQFIGSGGTVNFNTTSASLYSAVADNAVFGNITIPDNTTLSVTGNLNINGTLSVKGTIAETVPQPQIKLLTTNSVLEAIEGAQFNNSPLENKGKINLYASFTDLGSLTNNGEVHAKADINLPANWSNYGTGTLQVNSGNTATLTTNISAGTIKTDSNATLKLENYSATVQTISNNGKIEIPMGSTLSCTTNYDKTGTISINGIFDYSGTVATITNLEVKTGATIKGGTNGVTFTNATYGTYPVPAITTYGKVNLPTGYFGDLTISDGSTTLSGDTNVSSISISNKGNLTVTSGKTLSVNGNWTNSNTISGFTSNNSTVKFTDNATITGATTFYNLSTDSEIITNKTLTISSPITITNDLSLRGNSSTAKWTITGNGTIDIKNITDADFLYVAPKGTGPALSSTAISAGYQIIATNSAVTTSTDAPEGWLLFSEGAIYKWIGTTSTDWENDTNWNVGRKPDKKSSVEINKLSVTNPKYPVLSNKIEVAKLSIAADASISLNGKDVKISNTTTNEGWNNAGTVYSTGSENISVKTANETGTWIFNAGTIPVIENLTYKNIIVTGHVTVSNSVTLKTDGNLTVGAIDNTTASLTLNSANNLIVSGTFINYGNIIYSANGRIKNNSAVINDSENKGTVEFKAAENTIDNVEYANLTISNGDSTIGDEISVKGNIKITGSPTIKGTGSIKSSGATASTLSSSQTAKINVPLIIENTTGLSLSSDFTTTKSVTINSGATLVCNEHTLSIGTDFNNSGTFTCGTGKIVFNTTEESTIFGSNTFNNFECKTAGKTIKFASDETQSINGIFTIEGTNTSPIVLTHSGTSYWLLDVATNKASVKNAQIEYSRSKNLLITKLDNCSESTANTTFNWFGRLYTWTGTKNTSWDEPENWKVPGNINPTSAPAYTDEYASLIFNEAENSINHVEINSDISVKDIIVNSDCELNLKGFNLSLTSTATNSFDNKGTVKLYGGQTLPDSIKISNTTTSTVEYNPSTTTLAKPFGSSFGKLTVGSEATLQLGATSITINNTFENNGSIEINGTGTLFFANSGTMDTDSGLVKYSGTDTTVKDFGTTDYYNLEISGGKASFETNANLVIANKFSVTGGICELNGSITANSVEINSACTTTDDIKIITDLIEITADIAKTSNGESKNLFIYPITDTKVIYVGSNITGEFSLSYDEINHLKGKSLTIGNTENSGGIQINNTLNSLCELELITNDTITQTESSAYIGTSNGELHLQAKNGIGSITGNTPIAIGSVGGIVSAINSISGDIYLTITSTETAILGGTNSTLQTISTPSGDIKVSTAGSIQIGGNITATAGNLTLEATGSITNKPETTGKLSAGTVTLMSTTGIGSADSLIEVSSDKNIAESTISGGIYIKNNSNADYQITTNDANAFIKSYGFNFTETSAISVGTGIICLTAYTNTDAITLKDSDFGKLSSSGEIIIGDETQEGNITITNSSTNITLPADLIINCKTSGTITNKATILTNEHNFTVNGDLINNGTITGSSGSILITGDYSGIGSLTGSSNITTFNKNVDLSNTTFITNNGTIKFNRTEDNSTEDTYTLTVRTDESTQFNNVEITKYLKCSGNFKITGNWKNNGLFTGSGSTIHFAGNGTTQKIEGNATTTFNNFIIESNAKVDAQVSNINISGNWTNNSTEDAFIPNLSTVIFDSISVHEISGNQTFYNIELKNDVTFQEDSTQKVSGKLTINGNQDKKIILKSSTLGKEWNIDATNHEISYVNVSDSNNKNLTTRLLATGPSIDSGNNTRWNFTGVEYIWTGSKDSNWFKKDNWDKKSIPGIGACVTIPVVEATNFYPVLEDKLTNDDTNTASVGSTGTITVNENAILDLSIYDISVSEITNKGRIKLSGNQIINKNGIPLANAAVINNTENSIVEYYGNCNENELPMGLSYQNLEFTGNAVVSADSIEISIGKNLTLNTTGSIKLSASSLVNVKAGATCADLSLKTAGKNINFEGDFITTGTGPVILSTGSSTSANITFKNNVTAEGNLFITGNLITAGGSSSTAPAYITINGTNGLNITGNYSNTGFITANSKITVTGNVLNEGSANLLNTITLGKNFKDTGTWTSSSDSVGSIILNGTDNQIFTANPATIYNSITVNSQKNLTFEETTNITTLDVTEAADVKFSKPVIINTLNLTKTTNNTFEAAASIATLSIGTASTTKFNGTTSIGTLTDTATAGNFAFSGSSSITSDTVLLTTGTVTFGSSQNSTVTFTSTDNTTNYSVSHITGPTELYGTLSAADISLAKTNCNTELVINCDNFNLSGNLTNSADVAYAKLYGNLTLSGSITVSPDFILDGSLSGNTNSVFQKNLYLYTNSATPADISITDAIITEDLIIDSSRNINTSGTINANNVVLYNGAINAETNSLIKAEKDIVLLGKDYSIADTITNNPVEFIYQQTRLSPWNYNRSDFTQSATMPDGTELPKAIEEGGQTPPSPDSPAFNGTYTAAAGACIYAGKNFYANGVTLSGSDEWFVLIPDVTNGNNGFAETCYSQIDHSTVYCHSNTVSLEDDVKDGSKARMPAFRCGDNDNNTWWIFEDFAITEAYTVRDNAIYIKFNHPILNINNELTLSLNRFKNSDGENSYIGFYSDPDCTKPIQTGNILSGDVYIKAANSWNTDSTGTSAGLQDSTDRNGNHKESIPYIEISEKLSASEIKIADIWGKKATKYSGDDRFTEVQDKTGPVLYSVKTGQELHTIPDGTAESQHSYDAHNFIEFRYSEPTNFGSQDSEISTIWIPAYTDTNEINIAENIKVADSLGAVTGDITKTTSINLAGFGILENGKLYTGSKGKADKYVNALYRKDEYSICISIAGYTEGTVTDPSGNVYKNWVGYIEEAVLPTGTVTMNFITNDSKLNPVVSDINGNFQECYDDTTQNIIPEINNITGGVYGLWDISEPIFAPLRMSTTKTKDGQKINNWSSEILEGKYQSEAIGNTSGVGSTLDRIEFHLFDNTPTFNSADPEWVSEIGWINPGTEGKKSNLYKDFSYSADIFGGARTFDNENRTSGGIRYSSVCNEAGAFKYINSMYDDPTLDFATDKTAYSGATGLIFIGTSSPRRSALDLDGLYFGIPLPDSSYDIKTTFTVSYDSTNSFITDLAGNRLRSKTFQTIDRTPPSFDISLSPINQNELYVTFVKQLVTDSSELIYIDNDGNVKDVSVTGTFENLLSSCFKLITIDENGIPSDSTGLQIDSSRPAEIMDRSSERFTCIKLYLNQNVTLKDVETLYLAVTNHPDYNEYSQDPFTSHKDSRVTFIQDPNKNYMEMYTAHALSDFVIGAINPLYAYDQDMSAEDSQIMNGLYQEGSWAVHDWTAEQKNYGTLPANHSLALVANLDDGTTDKNNLPVKARIYLSNNPDSASVSKQYNADFKDDLRIWLPDATEKVFTALAEKNNTNYSFVDSQLLDSKDLSKGLLFDIPKEITQNWASQDQITFLFGLMDQNNNPINIIHSPELNMDVKEISYLSTSTKYPLYALRLENPADITSIDLWSFRVKSITEQRGGVSILNNVINNTVGEKTVVKVNLPEEGRLNVIIMTLDGNVVTYLQRGQTSAGEHYYAWDGKNKNGTPVARGLYFVRVIADDIDETRKVMVVK